MARFSHELLIPDHDFAFDTISDVEDPVDEELLAAGVGEVTGGGIGSGWYRIELELEKLDEAVAVLLRLAEKLSLPESTLLRPAGARHAEPLAAWAAKPSVDAQESGG